MQNLKKSKQRKYHKDDLVYTTKGKLRSWGEYLRKIQERYKYSKKYMERLNRMS